MKKPDSYVDKRQDEGERVSLDVPCGNNALKYPKPAYTTNVEDQEEITAMSYQEYYALHKDKIDEISGGSSKEKLAILAGFHKAGKRATEALKTRGVHWRESDKLREDDKHYIEIFEKNLSLLEQRGISLDEDPDKVLHTIKDTFGKIGEEIVTKSRRMPIFEEVITNEEDLQCGDRLLDKTYEKGSIRGLRGGLVRDTAMLHLLTTMTGQGVSDAGSQFEDFDVYIKATVEAGENAFSESDDTVGLKKRNVPDEEIAQEKEQGNFAIGSHMFTRGRHEETPTYFLLAEQLDCVISLSSNYGEFTQGNAPKKFSVDGVLSITQDQSEIERGINKMVHITLTNEAGEELHSATPITNRDGHFAYVLPKEILDKLEPGSYKVAGRFSGTVRTEELDCPNEISFTVKEKPEKIIPLPKKKEPMQVYVMRYSPRRSMASGINTTEDYMSLARGEEIAEDVFDIDPSKFPSLGKVSSPMCHDDVNITKKYSARVKVKTQDFKFGVKNAYKGLGIHGIIHVTAMERDRNVTIDVVREPSDYHGEREEHHKSVVLPTEKETQTDVGLEAGKEMRLIDDKVKVDLEGRIGRMFGEGSRTLVGLEAAVGNAGKTNQIAVSLSNELHKQISLSLRGTKAVIGGFSADLGIDLKDKPAIGIGLRYTFR